MQKMRCAGLSNKRTFFVFFYYFLLLHIFFFGLLRLMVSIMFYYRLLLVSLFTTLKRCATDPRIILFQFSFESLIHLLLTLVQRLFIIASYGYKLFIIGCCNHGWTIGPQNTPGTFDHGGPP